MATVKKTAKSPIARTAAGKPKPAAKKPIAKPPAKTAKARPAAKPKAAAAKKPAARKPAVKAPTKPAGLPEQLRDAVLKILDERQAEDVVVLDLAGRSAVADYMLIASGRAGRQIAAIADYIREAFMKLGVKRVRVEGLAEANWVLIDGGDVIVHLFRPEVRAYYDLDAIWNGQRPI